MTLDLTTAHTDDRPAAALRGLAAEVHLPGDPGYDAARVAWNLAVDQRPAAVVVPRTAAEVSAVVVRAKSSGLRVAPQSTGHNAGPLAARGLDDVVLVKMSAMADVRVDAATRTCRVEGGALWLPAVESAAGHNLAALHGSSPDVGIAGYSLGGGIGWYARKLGLATNSLTAIEIVIGDGTLVRADARHHPELFWALRGGGGNFGVVTALEFRLYPIASPYAGMLVWDISRADEVLRRWAGWAEVAPDEVTTSFRCLNLPPLPELPALLRGRSVVAIDGAVLASDEDAPRIIGDLRALRPEIDTFARVPAHSLVRLHMDPEGGAPAVSDSLMLSGLPAGAIDAFLDQVGPGSTSTLLGAELRQLGGALAKPHAGGGVASHLNGRFLAFGAAMAMTPEIGAQGLADAHRLMSSLTPYASGSAYLNFAENDINPQVAFSADSWRQLCAIRSTVDPDNVFAANHAVPRLYEGGRATC